MGIRDDFTFTEEEDAGRCHSPDVVLTGYDQFVRPPGRGPPAAAGTSGSRNREVYVNDETYHGGPTQVKLDDFYVTTVTGWHELLLVK